MKIMNLKLMIQEEDICLQIYREDDNFVFEMFNVNLPDEILSVYCDASEFLRLIQKV